MSEGECGQEPWPHRLQYEKSLSFSVSPTMMHKEWLDQKIALAAKKNTHSDEPFNLDSELTFFY